jgi:hypothetical protein
MMQAPASHTLKTLPDYFRAVESGEKTFEIRKNDRDFKVGDILVLEEWTGADFTGRKISREVTYLLPGDQFGIADGYCIMGIRRLGGTS